MKFYETTSTLQNATFYVVKSELIACESLCELISNWGFRVVGKSTNLGETIEQVRIRKPKYVILETTIDGKNAVGTINEIRLENPNIKFILISNTKDLNQISEVLLTDSCGFLNCNDGMKELKDCIVSTSTGNLKYYGIGFKELIKNYGINMINEETKNKLKELTKREKQILHLVADGLTADEIAGQLGISYWTFVNHKANIVRKLNLDGAKTLVKFGISVKSFL